MLWTQTARKTWRGRREGEKMRRRETEGELGVAGEIEKKMESKTERKTKNETHRKGEGKDRKWTGGAKARKK